MNFTSKAGRTTVTALALIAVSGLVGGAVLSSRAGAQTVGPITGRFSSFGPEFLEPGAPGAPGSKNALIGLLLPAVQRVQTPFRLEIMNADVDIVVPVPADLKTKNTNITDVYVMRSEATGGLEIHVRNQKGDEIVQPTGSADVTVHLLPAVQRNGNVVQPLGGSIHIHGSTNVTFADGSVIPIPFEDALPAVQNVGNVG